MTMDNLYYIDLINNQILIYCNLLIFVKTILEIRKVYI